MTGVLLPHIAFIGKAGAGKTTASQVLRDQQGYERLSFAEPLKVGCGTRDDRELLQKVGQGVRDLFPDFWVNLFLADVDSKVERREGPRADRRPPRRFVVDDCRYPNEVAALKGYGFVIVRVAASHALRLDRLKRNGRLQDEAQLNHVSETALDDFEADHRIVNIGWDTDLVADLVDLLNRVAS